VVCGAGGTVIQWTVIGYRREIISGIV
jgi:hypothetical protein